MKKEKKMFKNRFYYKSLSIRSCCFVLILVVADSVFTSTELFAQHISSLYSFRSFAPSYYGHFAFDRGGFDLTLPNIGQFIA